MGIFVAIYFGVMLCDFMSVLVINMKGFYIGLGFLSCMFRDLFLFCNSYVFLVCIYLPLLFTFVIGFA